VLTRVHHDVGHLHRISTAQLAGWLGRPGWSSQTRSTYYGHIVAYYRWAVAAGVLRTDPSARLTKPRTPANARRKAPPGAAVDVLRRLGEPWRTAAMLAAYAGLRCCEIVRLRREDVDVERIRIHGKGGRVDDLPTHPALWAHLAGRPPGVLVLSPRGRGYDARGLSSRFGAHCRRRLGVHVTLHRLRHHYADSLRRAGVDLAVVQQLLRHSSLATTQRYLDVSAEERAAAIRSLPTAA
jgi:integrase/recombinase XerC